MKTEMVLRIAYLIIEVIVVRGNSFHIFYNNGGQLSP